MAKATATWSGHKVKFDIESASGHGATIDEAPIFGDDEAMRPTEMLLGALGSCTGLNAVLLLKKFKQPLKSLVVEVEGEQDKEWPRAFKKIDVTFVLGWTLLCQAAGVWTPEPSVCWSVSMRRKTSWERRRRRARYASRLVLPAARRR